MKTRGIFSKSLARIPIRFSFSSQGEDLVLLRVLSQFQIESRDGFFVDLGAYHPALHSNTLLLYFQGWRGINVDLDHTSIAKFRIRKRDISVLAAVDSHQGAAVVYRMGDKSNVHHTLSRKEADNLLGIFPNMQSEPVQTQTLNGILECHLPSGSEIDVLLLDIQRKEYDALSGFNFAVYRPKVIVVEIYVSTVKEAMSHPVAVLLEKNNYVFVASCLITTFWVHKDVASKLDSVSLLL